MKHIGLAGSLYDAGAAIATALNTMEDPSATSMQKAGAFARAAFKSALVAARVNPIVNIVLTTADITGVTDAIFNW